MTTTENKIEFTRINNDVNGNPRYVCHFFALIGAQDRLELAKTDAIDIISAEYQLALKKAKLLGGKRFNNKQYGGGIVFQCNNIGNLSEQIAAVRETGKGLRERPF